LVKITVVSPYDFFLCVRHRRCSPLFFYPAFAVAAAAL